MESIENATYANSKPFHKMVEELLPPGLYQAKIVKVYDGDTVWATVNHREIFRIKLRLRNINTPEIRGGSEEEKAEGFKSKHFVEKLLLNKIVHIKITGVDKYSRFLAFIYPNIDVWRESFEWTFEDYMDALGKVEKNYEGSMELNEYMIHSGNAVSYMYSVDPAE